MHLGLYFLAWLILTPFAMHGSYRSIRAEWHREPHWSRVVRPRITWVCLPPVVVTAIGIRLVYPLIKESIGLPSAWSYIALVAFGSFVCWIAAHLIGKRAYAG